MFLARTIPHFGMTPRLAAVALLVLGTARSSQAAVRTCDAPPATTAALNACIATYGTPVDSRLEDTLLVSLTKGTRFTGAQVLIDRKKNVHLVGDTAAIPYLTTLPFIIYQDRAHTISDTTGMSNKLTYWEYNGAVLVNESRNIKIQGLGVNGANPGDSTGTTNKIFAFCGTYSTSACVDIKGNMGINIRNSYGVTVRGTTVTNTWYGVAVQGRNLGGAFSYPTPLDPPSQVNATLPTSRSGLYGRHVIEQSRFINNTWGTLFEYDWDLGSVVRNNLYVANYLRGYGKFPGYINGLELADARKNTLGQAQALRWNVVGGAFFMNGVALTPYRIHNNSFVNNGVVVGAYYMAGTQHLFYNNLVGRPYQYHNAAIATTDNATYTQTERATEMLQFYSEHQRSNLVQPQDGAPGSAALTQTMDMWGDLSTDWAKPGNFRMFRMKMNRRWNPASVSGLPPAPAASDWRGGERTWNNGPQDQDSLAVTWVPDAPAGQTVSQMSDTGGVVQYIRHNMYAASYLDPEDKNTTTSGYGLPYLPLNIRRNMADPKVFRDVSKFNIRWTTAIPFGAPTYPISPLYMKPDTTSNITQRAITGRGWPLYDGLAGKALDIGALRTTGGNGWAVPEVRLTLQDTLIEMMQGDTVGFRMDVSATGFASADIKTLKVAKAKFYYDVPVADTTFNAGGCRARNTSGDCTVGNDTTRWNSILSSKPWPIADTVINYNLWSVDDSLTAGKLKPTHFFIGKLSKGALPDSVYFARAEVVLEATLNDGRVVYSNPGVFMYSRPRFQLDVRLFNEAGQELPIDADGYSRRVLAGQKVLMSVTPKFDVASLPSTVSRFRDLQIGQTSLMGSDTANSRLERDATAANGWQKVSPNQIIEASLGKTQTVWDTLRFTEAGLVGSLTLRALFDVQDQRFLQGISKRVRVVASAIYQATIDSVYIGDSLVATPWPTVKRALDLLAPTGAGARDTLLKAMVGTRLDSSLNIGHFGDGVSGNVRIVLQVRDQFGNPVRDSSTADLLVKLQASDNATRFPNGLGATVAEAQGITIPGAAGGFAVRTFDSTGRVVFDSIRVGSMARSGVIVPMRSAVVLNQAGYPEITSGTGLRTGIPDTTWIQTVPPAFNILFVDTLAGLQKGPTSGLVGDLVPVRLKSIAYGKGTRVSANIALSADPSLRWFADPAGATPLTTVALVNDSLSAIVWVRAIDTTRSAAFSASATVAGELVAASVPGNVFRFPRLRAASFHDYDCDGRVDSLVLRFLDSVRFRGANLVFHDSLDLLFPGHILTSSAQGGAARFTRISDTVLAFGWNPAAMAAATPAANRLVLGNPLGGSDLVLFPSILQDKAPPLALSGTVDQSWQGLEPIDVVTVRFSEQIDTTIHGAGSLFPFNVKRKDVLVRLDTIAVASRIETVAPGIYAWTLKGRIGAILPGDSLVVSGSSIRDLAGNTTGDLCANNPFAPVIKARTMPYDVLVTDRDGDGNGDMLRFTWHDSIGTFPDRITIRWGTPAETLSISSAQLVALGVKSADSTFEVPFSSWKGQWITVDGDKVLAPRTDGPSDTASFYGGAIQVRIRDGIAPALIHARLLYDRSGASVQMDTLRLTFSEDIAKCPVGTDPNVCLDLSRTNTGGFNFPEGSTILDVQGDVMRVLVPSSSAATSVQAGDSLRAAPATNAGPITDSTWDGASNKVGDKTPWVPVRADRRPPRLGWFVDRNGDGVVEAVVLSYAQAVTDTTLPGFSFEWGDSAGRAVTSSGSSWSPLDASKLLWVVRLTSPFPYGATGYGPSAVRNLGTQSTQTTYSFPVRDSVGPVLLPGARLNPAAGSNPADTILVRTSETVANPTGKILLSFRRGNRTISSDSVIIFSAQPMDGNTWRVVIAPESPWHPAPGDSVRLSVSGSVKDTTRIGNQPHPDHRWVPLAGRPRPPYDAAYLDKNGNGAIDTWTASFVVPPSPGTVIRVLDPAGSGKFRDYLVTAADSVRTRFEITLDTAWAQDVTSLKTTDLGRLFVPGAAGAADTAAFPIRDAVEPVITKAYLGYTSDTTSVDTLVMTFSEDVSIDLENLLLAWKLANESDGREIKPVSVAWDSVNRTLTFLLEPVQDLEGRPEKGDMIRIVDNGAIKDKFGNTPQKVAKWTKVEGTRRIFAPALGLTNSMIIPDRNLVSNSPTGFQFVWRKPSSGNPESQLWRSEDLAGFDPATGERISAGPGSSSSILYLSTNLPTTISLYVYDLLGTFAASSTLEITQEMLDQFNAQVAIDDSLGRPSTVNMVDVGFRWNTRTGSGAAASTGVYVVRIVAIRRATPEELAAGANNIQVTNYLQNIGVKAPRD